MQYCQFKIHGILWNTDGHYFSCQTCNISEWNEVRSCDRKSCDRKSMTCIVKKKSMLHFCLSSQQTFRHGHAVSWSVKCMSPVNYGNLAPSVQTYYHIIAFVEKMYFGVFKSTWNRMHDMLKRKDVNFIATLKSPQCLFFFGMHTTGVWQFHHATPT